MAITWRNINAPDLRGVSAMTAQAGNAFSGALDSLGQIAEQQEGILANEKAANTQEALEAIQSIKDIETYNNTSMDQLIGKYGEQINRREVFNAFTGRDDQIWSEQDALQQRTDKELLREMSGTTDNYISEGKLGNKSEEQLKDGFEALIADKPAHIKAELRNQFMKQLEWENTLTPEGQRLYDIQTKKLQNEFDLVDRNTSEMIQQQQAIIAKDPMKRISEIDAELSIADYVNKYAPDEFELDWNKYEGDDIEELLTEARSDRDLLNKINAQLPKGEKMSYIPEQVFEYVIKTAVRTTDNKLRLGNFEDNVFRTALEFNAYHKDAKTAQANIRKLERQRTNAANTLYGGLEKVRSSIQSQNKLIGN